MVSFKTDISFLGNVFLLASENWAITLSSLQIAYLFKDKMNDIQKKYYKGYCLFKRTYVLDNVFQTFKCIFVLLTYEYFFLFSFQILYNPSFQLHSILVLCSLFY